MVVERPVDAATRVERGVSQMGCTANMAGISLHLASHVVWR